MRLLLLLGAEYGERTERGVSATEDEFNEALRLGIPVVALVQQGARSEEQAQFVQRVRGGWSEGRFAPSFAGAGDIGFAVVAALNAWRQSGPAAEQKKTRALDRARELALGTGRPGQSHTGAKARAVMVPVLDRAIMDAVKLGQPELTNELVLHVRTSGLVSHEMALTHVLTADGFQFEAVNSRGYERLRMTIGTDGAIVAEGAVSGKGLLGSSVIQASSLRRVIEQVCVFALSVWRQIDSRDDVHSVAVTVAIPDASLKVYSDEDFEGTSLRMGSMGTPAVLVAPDPPSMVRREDLGASTLVDQLVAEVRHAFVLQDSTR